jgi:hypothetical protein
MNKLIYKSKGDCVMSQMKSLQEYIQDSKVSTIFTIEQWINRHITENWQVVREEKRAQLLDAYQKAGDMAYGTYLNLLFLPVHKQLKEVGFSAEPRLPGDFDISREWGNTPDLSDQERWMWSTITEVKSNKSIGTIVTKVYHDHTQFRLPRAPIVMALSETTKKEVLEVLSQHSPDFKQALEFHEEYAEYMKNNQ